MDEWLRELEPALDKVKKRSERSIEVKPPALLGKYVRPTNRPTDEQTDRIIGKFQFQ